MRCVIQRVSEASVKSNGEECGRIGRGLMVLIGLALMMRFPVWWGYLIGCVIGGFGVFGLLAGLAELVKCLSGARKTP